MVNGQTRGKNKISAFLHFFYCHRTKPVMSRVEKQVSDFYIR